METDAPREDWSKYISFELERDVTSLLNQLAGADVPVLRRSLVRAVFAFIEGVTFTLKQDCLKVVNDLRPEEIALLQDQSFSLEDGGRAAMRPAMLPLLANVRFALNTYARCTQGGYTLDVSGEGWKALRDAVVVRNRLMHPKKPEDLVVSNDELKDTLRAFRWMYANALLAVTSNNDVLAEALSNRGVEVQRQVKRAEVEKVHLEFLR